VTDKGLLAWQKFSAVRCKDALWSVCRELALPPLAASGVPMYRRCVNHRHGSHAKFEALGHNFNEMSFTIGSTGVLAKALTDKPRLLPEQGQFTQGV
jgi:hypothetical protein